MGQYRTEERTKVKRRLVERAIQAAMQSRWTEAIDANREILELYPQDVDALNRLGRALMELGRYGEARAAYSRAAEIDPNNSIAHRNLARLSTLSEEVAPAPVAERVDPRLFIAETGKSGVTTLVRPADRATLAKMSVGDQVYFRIDGRALLVTNGRGEYLGQVEPKLAQRLIELMRGGNRYAAGLMSIEDSTLKIIVKEIYQDPSQIGKVSFPSKGPEAAAIRPYIKVGLLREEIEEEEESEEAEAGFGLEHEGEELAEEIEPTFEEEE